MIEKDIITVFNCGCRTDRPYKLNKRRRGICPECGEECGIDYKIGRCMDCGEPVRLLRFHGIGKPIRCRPCYDKHHSEYMWNYYHKRKEGATILPKKVAKLVGMASKRRHDCRDYEKCFWTQDDLDCRKCGKFHPKGAADWFQPMADDIAERRVCL
jgi:hypothetical protein